MLFQIYTTFSTLLQGVGDNLIYFGGKSSRINGINPPIAFVLACVFQSIQDGEDSLGPKKKLALVLFNIYSNSNFQGNIIQIAI